MTPHRLTPRIQRQSSSLTSQIGPPRPMPALLCTRCTAPKRSSAWSRSACTDATIGDVGHHAECLGPLARQVPDGLLERALLDVAQDDLHAVGGGAVRHGPPDATGPARDHRHLALQVFHRPLPCSSVLRPARSQPRRRGCGQRRRRRVVRPATVERCRRRWSAPAGETEISAPRPGSRCRTDEAPVVGVLPDGQAWARRAPHLHDLVVGARAPGRPTRAGRGSGRRRRHRGMHVTIVAPSRLRAARRSPPAP